MNSFKIRPFGMFRSHWSTMLLSRCTRWIDTKWTYIKRIRIGRYSSQNISKFGKISMIIYLLAN
ncbi:hypothetical protein Gotur_020156 [Gossypium turneri]